MSFFSVGTNDLTQYTLAIDRQNAKLETFHDPHHPAIMSLLRTIVEIAPTPKGYGPHRPRLVLPACEMAASWKWVMMRWL
ncbi:MAG: putative PEP-binding protein [Oscillospiraceae bacterium]